MTAESSIQPELQLRDFIRILKRRKGIILLSLIVCVVGAIIYSMMATPTYRSIARILVTASRQQDPTIDQDPVKQYSPGSMAPDIESQIGVLQSPLLLEQVFQRAGVPMPSQDDLDQNVIQVRQLGSSNIVDVMVSLSNKEDAVKVAQEIPRAYGEYMQSARDQQVRRLLQYTEKRYQDEKDLLSKANAAMAAFRNDEATKGELVAVGTNDDQEREFRLRTAEFQLNDATGKEAGARQRVDEIRAQLAKTPEFKVDPATTSSFEARTNQRARVAALKEKLDSLRAVKNDDHPDVLQAKAEYDAAQNYLYKGIPEMEQRTSRIKNPEIEYYQRLLTEAKAALVDAQAQVASYRATRDQQRSLLSDYSKLQTKRSELQREIDLRTSSVANFSKALDDLRLRTSSVKDPLTPLLISSAEQVSPKFVRSIIIGIFLGLVLGIILAVVRDRVDDRVYTLDQIQEGVGVLALGRVPQAERTLALVPGSERGQSTALESYRSLRFSMDSTNKEGFVQSIVLASPTAAEGRAELAYNLAVEAARDLRRTILIESDLRKPSLHQLANVPATPGLTDYLMGQATLDEILHSTMNSYLTIIPAGTAVENPLQLLTSPQMTTLHTELQKRADAIFFNSPSLLRYADGRAIAKIANAAVLVAKKGVSKRNALRYCAEMLRRTNTRMLGVVLNDTASGSNDVPYFYTTEEFSA